MNPATSSDRQAIDPQGSAGAYAAGHLADELRRIVALQPAVLADEDPEPLHQLRVALRRLRTTLMQFERALVLSAAVSEENIARVTRRLGVARDLDVLRQRLEEEFVPALSAGERQVFKPILKQLRRERHLAFSDLENQLKRSRYLSMLAALQNWLKKPLFTPLGREPVVAWLTEWPKPCLSGLLTHPGWWATDPQRDGRVLHDLRRHVKAARYGLENLQPLLQGHADGWILRLKCVQSCLGDLQDLQVLAQALGDQLDAPLGQVLPSLETELERRRGLAWARWRLLAAEALDPGERQRLNQILSAT
jgi:CHAD domain-containing protein